MPTKYEVENGRRYIGDLKGEEIWVPETYKRWHCDSDHGDRVAVPWSDRTGWSCPICDELLTEYPFDAS